MIPQAVKYELHTNELCLQELTVEKLELVVSVHASIKVFVASDQAPVTLAKFNRLNIVSTREQVLADLAFHYGTGALYNAGWSRRTTFVLEKHIWCLMISIRFGSR